MKIKKNRIKENKVRSNSNEFINFTNLDNYNRDLGNEEVNYLEGRVLNDLEVRLKRIEGQIKGIYKMIRNKRNCEDILFQIIAVRAALNSVAIRLLDNYIKSCIKLALKNGDHIVIDNFSNLLDKIFKNF